MTAFSATDILLPRLSASEMTKWSVVACDQYTGEPEYWEKTAEIVGGAPSTLDLILPEIYLGNGDERRIESINCAMERYLSDGLFEEYRDCLVLTRRVQADGRVRTGLVGAIDLEMYDYSKGSRSQVRATEATVASRIPPRVKIRREAPLELPHIMILIDDEERTVIEPLEAETGSMEKVYDFELMQNGGHLEGTVLKGDRARSALSALDKLADKAASRSPGLSREEILLYAMGDGNHSLATAKECYEQKKREGSPDAALARYALAEIVNLHSPALEFEAIHRVITGADADKLYADMTKALGLTDGGAEQSFTFICGGREKRVGITAPSSNLTVGSLQSFLDRWLAENAGTIDYIHGENVVRSLCGKNNAVGFLLPPMKKSELFPTVIKDGALPRKTFSMGHANDKRFYCEARRIRT